MCSYGLFTMVFEYCLKLHSISFYIILILVTMFLSVYIYVLMQKNQFAMWLLNKVSLSRLLHMQIKPNYSQNTPKH